MSTPDGPPDGFLARWSKRKRAAIAPESVAPQSGPASGDAASAANTASLDAVMPVEAEPEFDVSTLPALEELTAETDIRGFLQRGVPEALKNAALRKAWALDPFLRDYVGPVENGYNFNDPASIPGFGEMDVRVDNSAMLRQIMGTPDPDAAPEVATVDAVATEAPAPASALLQAPVVDENDSLESLADRDEKSSRDDEARGIENAALHNKPIENIEENLPSPRKKRHGGAVPN